MLGLVGRRDGRISITLSIVTYNLQSGNRQTGFDCAPWVHKASTLPGEEFTREVDRKC
jgi:hypothetical protein